jgi:hypothetical protein
MNANDSARERSRCPGCSREIRCEDFWFRGSDFRIISDGCDPTLLSVEEYRR